MGSVYLTLNNMADIKLTYFNGLGRAEISRLILTYAGVQFEDDRITGEQLAEMKSSLAYGQLPKLEYKGTTLYQSVTIARFLAKEFGIGGNSNLEKVLEKRGGQFFVGNAFSWAELHLLQLVDIILSMKMEQALEATPKVANLMARTRNVPNIKKYLEDRPASEF